MSPALIIHSPDLKQLQEEGYELSIVEGFLVVDAIPYLNSSKEIAFGSLVSELTLAGERTAPPGTHVMHFAGDHPCNKDGTKMAAIAHSSGDQKLAEGVIVNHSFSNKPPQGYRDYYHKVDRYAEMISAPVRSMDPSITAKTHRLADSALEESVFQYTDTNSSRAEILVITAKVKGQRIGIVGGGGTASYVLDFVAKCPVAEIHIYDKDQLLQHNAFRAPGAAPLEVLRQAPRKVDYLTNVYSHMHKHVIPHPYWIDENNVAELLELNFVFICVDKGSVKG